MRKITLWLVVASLSTGATHAEITPPRALVEGVRVELVGSEPQIVTPVGLMFDRRGRLLVVESHTHKRQEGYSGPKHDRVRTLVDSDRDGRLDEWGTFAEGYTHALNLVMHPTNGDIYLVCRNEVRRLRDTDDDGVADQDEIIVRCQTEQKYPHNGLGGVAYQGGKLYLGMGENFDAPFELIGSDGSRIVGRGGEGLIFTCNPAGGELQCYARGFWNPFGLCGVGHQVFAVDNDPHASPPCRLLHVLPAGDYGHRREYNSDGLHPLQAWDGELPGALGMMAGVGEAPCTVLLHKGWLWVTSWGEHRVERYQLKAKGTTYEAVREVVVQGEADFRPTGMVVASDGSLYVADWVSRSYPVHGAGRIWRVTLPEETADKAVWRLGPALRRKSLQVLPEASPLERLREIEQRYPSDLLTRQSFLKLIADDLAASGGGEIESLTSLPRPRLAWLQALRASRVEAVEKPLRFALRDPDADVRLFAVRWIADHHLIGFKQDVAKLLEDEIPSERYYLAVLAAVDWLSRPPENRARNFADGLLARELRNDRRSDGLKSIALRAISPDHKQLTPGALRAFLASGHEPLRTEAVRTLAVQANQERYALLEEVVGDERFSESLRADAVAGLAGDALGRQKLLDALAESDGLPAVRREAQRVLRLAKLRPSHAEAKPSAKETDAWLELIDLQSGDADSGRRLFHSAIGARCGVCHQHSGRGGRIGPDLTLTAQKLSRRRLVESILQPSAEIAPQYTPWVLETADGRVLTGLRQHQPGDNGRETYADSQGKRFTLRSDEIDFRTPGQLSIMPQGLEQTVSVQDLRDLLAFLEGEG